MSTHSSQLNPVVLIATILLTIAAQALCETTSDKVGGTDTIARRQAHDPTVTPTSSSSSLVATGTAEQLTFSQFERPRQFFKIHITPGAQRNSKRAAIRDAATVRRNSGNSETTYHETGKQKISNAALKKLLNQSLLKASNGSLTGNGPKASNFKFLFIQKATPKSTAHNKDTTTTTNLAKEKDSATGSGTKSPSTSTISPSESHSTVSLAASVSKHLANTLLSSASDIVANLSSVQSLTSLASQIVAQTLDQRIQNSLKSNSSSSNENSIAIKGDKKKSRPPSKIYNLPVKFVANGQPNHVVINTIRQHFATIKKIQGDRQKFTTKLDHGNKRSKNRPHHHVQKVKGNSRFIYLPLKYLSNARPNKVLIGKALTT